MKTLLTIAFMLILLSTHAQRRNSGNDDSQRNSGLVMTVGGIAFTTSAIIETGYSYGTNVVTKPSTPTSSQQVSYVTPPFWKQTPRNIMLVVGVTLTVTGLITALSK